MSVVAVHTCNSTTQMAEAGGLRGVQFQVLLQHETEVNLRSHLKKKVCELVCIGSRVYVRLYWVAHCLRYQSLTMTITCILLILHTMAVKILVSEWSYPLEWPWGLRTEIGGGVWCLLPFPLVNSIAIELVAPAVSPWADACYLGHMES